MSNLSTLPKGDSAWLLRKAIERIIQQVSVLETNIGSSTTGNSANTQVIFNDNGVLRGDSDLIFNTALNRLVVTNLESTASLLVGTSATITGDLTVDTSTLKVSSSTDTVCVGATTTDAKFRVVDANYNGIRIGFLPGTANYNLYDATVHEFRTANVTPQFLYTFSATSAIWGDGAGGTRMTLNSTGLGVGVSPSYKLDIGATTNLLRISSASGNDCNIVLSQSGVGNWMIYNSATAGLLKFQFGGNDRVTIDQTGNVGVGVTPANDKLLVLNTIGINTATTGDLSFRNVVGTAQQRIRYNDSDGSLTIGSAQAVSYALYFGGNTTTRAMTLDASGNLLVGGTSVLVGGTRCQIGNTTAANQYQLVLLNDGTVKNEMMYIGFGRQTFHAGVNPSDQYYVFNDSNVGVYLTNGGTSWTATSDERLKDIIEPINNAVAKVSSLRSVIGKFKTDSEGTRRSFLIAQDVQSALPEAVDSSNTDALGVRYTEVIPLLVAAIKELTARVEALEA